MVTIDRHQRQVCQSVAQSELVGSWRTPETAGDIFSPCDVNKHLKSVGYKASSVGIQRQNQSQEPMLLSPPASAPASAAGRISSQRRPMPDSDRDDEPGGYDVEVVDLSEGERVRYVCPVCLLLLRDPLQTTCGHRFCQRCIHRWCRETPECPSCKNRLSVQHDLFPDNCAKREILNLTSVCPNRKHGCDSMLPLGQLQAHLKVCTAAKERCEFCGEQIAKLEMERHQMQTCTATIVECSFRLFGCQYKCERRHVSEHLSQCVEQHLLLVANYVASHSCCCSGEQRVSAGTQPHHTCQHQQQHQTSFTEPIKLPSHNQGETYDDLVAVSMPARAADADVDLPPSYFTDERLREICRALQERQPASRSAAKQLATGALYPLVPTSDVSNSAYPGVGCPIKLGAGHQLDNTTTSSTNQDLLHTMTQQSMKIAQYESRVARLEARVLELESDSGCRNGIFIMKIDSFTGRRLPEARSGQTPVIYSQAFYTHPQGYKFCLRVHPVGLSPPSQSPGGGTSGPYLSLFIHLMRGDYDDVLDWPFRGRITLAVLDIRSGSGSSASGRSTSNSKGQQQQQVPKKKDITACVQDTDPSLDAFQRPTLPRSRRGFGYVEFAPLTDFHIGSGYDPASSPYLIDDTLFIRATVEPAKISG